MKKLLCSLILIFSLSSLIAQDLRDAYRYSKTELSGTSRFIGMSGAFGALGGDISAMSLNPASSAVFLSSSASVTLGYRNLNNHILFNNTRTSSDNDEVELSNAGGVFVFLDNENSEWRKIAVGINYTNEASYKESFIAQGFTSNSIDQYFLDYADGIPLDLIQLQGSESISDLYSYLGETSGYAAQQAFLGYQAYIIEPEMDDATNTSYFSLISPGNFDQDYRYSATGLNGKVSFNAATQYKDLLYLGINLNSHFINYQNSTELNEFNNNAGSETTEVYFGNTLNTNGEGFSLQIGGIAKVTENIRLGLTYDSPTWYNIWEESTQFLESNNRLDEFVSVSPQVLNVYPEYQLRLPSKINASMAFLFGKQGLVSFDYGRKDYSNMKFSSDYNIAYSDLNNLISDEMKAASTYRIGGEYRISNLSLRAGYRFEESPFKNENAVGDLTGYSGGFGYSFGNFNVDFGYSFANYKDSSTSFIQSNTIDRDLSKMALTLTFGL